MKDLFSEQNHENVTTSFYPSFKYFCSLCLLILS
ncbi:hypothetical protein T4C_7553 [Trichinella pseudospiralis]|uniref:Uncharacterized protein n=1 Tax=Trichinella pseudospiralis TaxID=6337 RepID=A0A0V1GKC7_TRIPS|nr:hypothetical protein T4C_7553 [Trichinella pseudospiralis]